MSLWLTQDEIIELTGYKQPSRWKAALARMNVKFTSRDADGFPLVARAQYIHEPPRRKEPNWGATA